MTKKDYELIATALHEQRNLIPAHLDEMGFRKVVSDISAALTHTNPNFDRSRFNHWAGFCDNYNELTLPDEKGKCSLCHQHKV